MSKQLLIVGPGKEMESGLFPSVQPLSAPFWADGENVIFKNGGLFSAPGYEVLTTTPGAIFELAQAYNEGEQRIYISVGTQVILFSSASGQTALGNFPTEGVPYFETFGTFLLGTNGVDPVRIWPNQGTFDKLVGNPTALTFTRAKLLHRKDNYILAFNTDLGQNHYAWCDTSNVYDWEPRADNAAGDNWLRDLDSEIVAVRDIGQATAIYSRETMVLITFVGQPNVFASRDAINGVGAVGAHSVAQAGAYNYGLSSQGIFRTDGFSFQYLDDPAVNTLLDEIDFTRGEHVQSYHNESKSLITWFYDTLAGLRKGIGYNYVKKVFTVFAMDVEGVIERQVYTYPLAAVGSDIVLLNKGTDAGTSALTKWARTKPLSAGGGDIWKTWSHLKLVGEWSGATVKFGAMDDPDSGVVDWFDEQSLAYEVWPSPPRDTPYLVLEFRVTTLGGHFGITQIQLLGEAGGKVSL